MKTVTVIHVKSPNDSNGNPRRLYLVQKGAEILGAVDEGYNGDRALEKYVGGAVMRKSISSDIRVPPAEYKRLLKYHGPKSDNFKLKSK
jgi:hypothetical protein